MCLNGADACRVNRIVHPHRQRGNNRATAPFPCHRRYDASARDACHANARQGKRCILKDCCRILPGTILGPDTVVPSFTVFGGIPGVRSQRRHMLRVVRCSFVALRRYPGACGQYRACATVCATTGAAAPLPGGLCCDCDCDCVLKRTHSILESCPTVWQEAVLGSSPSVRRSYSASTLWIITSVFRPRFDSKLTVDSFGYPGRH